MRCLRLTITVPLLDLYADARVPINRGDDLVFHTKRPNEFFKSSKFVKRARELIKENEISGLQIWSQRAKHKERRGEHISIQVDDQAACQVSTADEKRKGILKQSHLEAATWIVDIWNCAVCVEVSCGLGRSPPLWETREGIESNEARVGTGNPSEPQSHGIAPVYAELEI